MHAASLRNLLCAVVTSVWLGSSTLPSMAGESAFESLSFRGGFVGTSFLGEEYSEGNWQQYDLVASIRLPLEWYTESGWGVGTRLLVSAGALRGKQETNGIATLVPVIAFGRRDGRLSLDVGGGAALLSDYKYGSQNFGGPVQYVWTWGVTSRILGPLGLGYHFQHYSDAGMYGSDSRGVDLHLFEISYWFGIRE